MPHGLALPKARAQNSSASPAASTSAAAQGGPSNAAQGGLVSNPEDAVKQFAEGHLQELIAQAKGASPGASNAASPAPSNAAGEEGALQAKGVPVPTLQYVARSRARLSARRNMVATVDLGTRLDLKSIALHARNAEYNPKVSLAAV